MKKCINCKIELSTENQYEYARKNYIHKCKDCLNHEKKIFARSIPKDRKKVICDKFRNKRKAENPKKH